jgi:hypothetical protein
MAEVDIMTDSGGDIVVTSVALTGPPGANGTDGADGVTALVNGVLELPAIADPGVTAAGFVGIFCRDNGSGKMQVCVRLPTGSVLVLGTEA